jgi:hypothetical protein
LHLKESCTAELFHKLIVTKLSTKAGNDLLPFFSFF